MSNPTPRVLYDGTDSSITSAYEKKINKIYQEIKYGLCHKAEFGKKECKKTKDLFLFIESQSKKPFRRIELLKGFLVDANLSDLPPYCNLHPDFFAQLKKTYLSIFDMVFDNDLLDKDILT